MKQNEGGPAAVEAILAPLTGREGTTREREKGKEWAKNKDAPTRRWQRFPSHHRSILALASNLSFCASNFPKV